MSRITLKDLADNAYTRQLTKPQYLKLRDTETIANAFEDALGGNPTLEEVKEEDFHAKKYILGSAVAELIYEKEQPKNKQHWITIGMSKQLRAEINNALVGI
jgi:hypothetical protein